MFLQLVYMQGPGTCLIPGCTVVYVCVSAGVALVLVARRYFTGAIEYHHIHHLSPLVPMYRLPECHDNAGDLFKNVPRVTLLDGARWVTPMVWDHSVDKFVAV